MAAAIAVALLLLGSPVLGGDAVDDRAATPEERARVGSALTALGYADVHDVELDDGRFEADATSPEGRNVDLELDTDTLEVLEVDDD